MRQKRIAVWAAVLFSLILTGCAFTTSAEELYRLPKLPAEYDSLEKQIDLLLADGMQHTSPTTGSNLQSVQMIDLDGDGIEEAVAFFLDMTDDKPMKVYIFKFAALSGQYEQYALIEGTASSIYSIAYHDLNNDGCREIQLGYKSGSDLQILAVFTLLEGKPEMLLSTLYSRYVLSDLDGEGRQELTVFHSSEDGGCIADCYTWVDNQIELRSSIELSFSGAELKNAAEGMLSDGVRAIFATGVADNTVSVTDILVLQDGILRNVMPRPGETSRFYDLYPEDVNHDGITELPEPVPYLTKDGEGEEYYHINWRQYDASGASQVVYRSFSNTQDGWVLALPEQWDDTVTVERTVGAEESAVYFSECSGGAESKAFLVIRKLTGTAREVRASMGERFVLAWQMDTVYSAEILDREASSAAVMDEETLLESFSLITGSWSAGETIELSGAALE